MGRPAVAITVSAAERQELEFPFLRYYIGAV